MMRVLAFALALAAGQACALDLQGHRGARGLLPENTLPSFQRALEIGVTTLETDIAITSDGVLAIYHDRTLNPDITRDAAGRFLADLGAAADLRRRPHQARQQLCAQLLRAEAARRHPHSASGGRF
jgi:glycerophosphoryl diester phosphodiesterase